VYETTGAYSLAAKALQNWLNANDAGRTGNITADGYWGGKTTEKLRSHLYWQGCLPSGYSPYTVDGKDSTGKTWVFNEQEAQATAWCLNQRRF
jgi:hypothetical protein